MKIKFKNQSYQDDAVNSIVDVFIGQTNGFRRDLIGRQIVDRAKIQRIIFEFDYYEKAGCIVHLDGAAGLTKLFEKIVSVLEG